MSQEKIVVSSSPHLRQDKDIKKIMWSVVFALLPAVIASYLAFGWRAILVIFISTVFALLSEFVVFKLRKMPNNLGDGSAAVAGILLALTLPANVPLYVPAVGAVFAVAIAKHAFGGLGMNIWNPALAARAFLLASFPGYIVMAKWPLLKEVAVGNIASKADVLTMATPLEALKKGALVASSNLEIFLGHIPGSLGEASALALLIGGLFLIYKGYVNWRLPLTYIATVALLTFILPAKTATGYAAFFSGPVFIHVFSGGLFLGAFFMASDMVTSPFTNKGQIIFAFGCGLLTALIRLYGGYPEGVCYAILIMNTFVPLIDRLTTPRKFGGTV